MVQFTTFLALATSLLVTGASAQTSPNLFLDGLAAKFGNTGLVTRQSGSPAFDPSLIPSSCQSQCGVLSEITSCTAPSCICSESVSAKLSSCIGCALSQDKSVSTSQGQAAMDSFISSCKALGITLKGQTVGRNSAQQMAMGISSVVAAGGAVFFLL